MTKMTKKEQEEFMKQYRQHKKLHSQILTFIANLFVWGIYLTLLFLVASVCKVVIEWGISVW